MEHLKTLYKKNVNGSIQQWTVYFDKDEYWTEYGQVGGKLITTVPVKALPKNIGKKNETTGTEQAFKEATAIYKLKMKSENYVENMDDVDKLVFQEPMLAHNYSGVFDSSMKYISPKLDGIRCNMKFNENTGLIEAISRKNNPFSTVEHIKEQLNEFLQEHPSIHLDGELYNHQFHDDFNQIVSLVKTSKELTEEQLDKVKKYVKYNIYDFWDEEHPELTFSERIKFLEEKLSGINTISIVPAYQVATEEELNQKYNFLVGDGFEGGIIRKDTPYEHKRSRNLLKFKSFKSHEFKILDVLEGTGNKSKMAGAVIIDLGNGDTCKSNIKGNRELCKKMLEDKDSYIGKMGTITYFEKTPDGKLRFPYLTTIRDYE